MPPRAKLSTETSEGIAKQRVARDAMFFCGRCRCQLDLHGLEGVVAKRLNSVMNRACAPVRGKSCASLGRKSLSLVAYPGRLWHRFPACRLLPRASATILRERSRWLRPRIQTRALLQIGADHHRPLSLRQCARASAGPVGSGPDGGEDEELRTVVRCSYQEWTANDHLRRVRYAGVREDTDAREVVKET